MGERDFIRLQPDSTGKKVDNLKFNEGPGDDRYRQITAIGDMDTTSRMAMVTASFGLRTVVGDPVDSSRMALVSVDGFAARYTPDRFIETTVNTPGTSVTLEVAGETGVGIQILPSFSGEAASVIYEISFDGGGSWHTTRVGDLLNWPSSGDITWSQTTSLTGQTLVRRFFSQLPPGVSHFRVRFTALSGGSAVVHLRSSQAGWDAILPYYLGQQADAEATGDGSLIAITKRIRTLLGIGIKTSTITSPARMTLNSTSALTILAANANRRRLMVQVVGTSSVAFLGLGNVDPTTGRYHAALAPGGSGDDGRGSMFIDEMWQGRVAGIGSGSGCDIVFSEAT